MSRFESVFGCFACVVLLACQSTPDASGVVDAVPHDTASEDADAEVIVFLDRERYRDLLEIDESLPFGVVARHAADGDVLGARWGRHGGPMVTTEVYRTPSGPNPPGVVRWSIPRAATEDASAVELAFAMAPALPVRFFYGADGMIDLPFGPYGLLTYTGAGAGYPGEVLLYSKDYDALLSRAHVNGLYSAAGYGDRGLLYSGLSPISEVATTTDQNGLYRAELCEDGSFTSCRASVLLFSWRGYSGPVAIDAEGNGFVVASNAGAEHSDSIYAVSREALERYEPATPVVLAEVDTRGTSSLAVLAPGDETQGWVFAKGFDSTQPASVYAQAYSTRGGLRRSGETISDALRPGPEVEAFSVFAGNDGDLWLAVDATRGRAWVQLRRREAIATP